MASAAGPFPIYYNPDVHSFYIKQKHEFHFNQKSDNEFLMFLLDTAVRVISIVQHLAPVIEAVSDASTEIDETDGIDDLSPANTPNPTISLPGTMEVDTSNVSTSLPLSVELEQINQEITNAQITSQQQASKAPFSATSRRLHQSYQTPDNGTAVENAPMQISATNSHPAVRSSTPLAPMLVEPDPKVTTSQSVNHNSPETLAPNVPASQLPTSAQSSENIPTSMPSAVQPVAEAPDDIKKEQPVPEMIEIKEEMDDTGHQESSSGGELIPPDTLQHLMSSISAAEDSSGIQNFVPTATPSSLPPSFLDRGSSNPLSMVGSISSSDGAGPSGLNIPTISESMMKNISDAGLNVSSIKGQANPIKNGYSCRVCSKTFTGSYSMSHFRLHYRTVHLRVPIYTCEICGRTFSRNDNGKRHFKSCSERLSIP